MPATLLLDFNSRSAKVLNPLERELIGLYLFLSTLFRERSHCGTIKEDYAIGQDLVTKMPLPILPFPSIGFQPTLNIGPSPFG